jgi:hypothetical protein
VINRVRVLGCIVLTMLLFTASGVGQSNTDSFTRIETSVAQKQPGWKLTKKRLYPKIEQGLFVWENGKSVVAIHVFLCDSADEASTRLKTLPLLYNGGGSDVASLNMTVLRATVPHLGDENFLWEAHDKEGVMGVDFRKGRVVVHTNASSIAVAEQFAMQIAEAISTS